MNRFQYRQMFLFLVVLVLPTVAIIALSYRNSAYQRELVEKEQEKKQEENRKRFADDIRQDVRARLDAIKLVQIEGASSRSLPQTAMYSDPAVAFVGRQEGERLIWDWDVAVAPTFPLDDQQSRFSLKMEEAERVELRDRNYAEAADLYRQAIHLAKSDSQRRSAQLLLASALTRSGATAESTRLYRELLSLPSTLIDDRGVPFASYAAVRLSESHPADAQVLERLKRDLQSPVPLAPGQAYRMRSILESLQGSPETEAFKEQLEERIRDMEQALEVQQNFQSLRVTADTWQLYPGTALWWIGKAPTGVSSPPLILAVRLEEIQKSVQKDRKSRGGPAFEIVTDGTAGEPLGESLPGARLVLAADTAGETPAGLLVPQSFYGLALFLVVMLTFVGAFFLWRDTRRESRMAEMRSQFVASVSHELKTPLTSIRMFAEAMQMDEESGSSNPKERLEYLDTIVCETERLTRLLNNVLDFSRIERGQKNYHLQPEELSSVVGDAVRTMRFPLAEQGFNLQVDLCEELPRVKVDRDAVEQAVLNLLSNAMKYSGKSRDIGLRLCRRNGDALIQVSDCGIGIPAEEQHRIFEKFYRVPSKENRAISGTGLGLALVAHVAEAHGGAVEVESRLGTGSTFSIRLPLNGAHA